MICFTNMLSAQTQQNGIGATEGAAISPSANTDYLWADSTAFRWMVSVNGAAKQPMSIWACPTQLGGIVYSSSPLGSSNVNAEQCLSLPATPVAGVPLLIGSSLNAPQWGAANLDIQGNALVTEFQPNSTTPPQSNQLVIFVTVSGNSTVQNAGTSSTAIIEGVCITNCNATGPSQIARAGIAGCKFYNTTTAGDYVQSSTNTAGYCQDLGSTYPTNGRQVIGRVLATDSGSTGHVVNIVLYAADVIAHLTSSGNGTKYQTTNVSTNTAGDVATYDGNGNIQDSGLPISVAIFPFTAGGTLSASSTDYIGVGQFGTGESAVEIPISRAGTVKNLYCRYATALTGTMSGAITLRQNAASSSITCTVNSSSQTCNDPTHSVTVAVGDLLDLQWVPSNSPTASALNCTVNIQ